MLHTCSGVVPEMVRSECVLPNHMPNGHEAFSGRLEIPGHEA